VLDLNDVVTGVESLLRRLIGPDVEVVLRLDPDLAIVRADPTLIEQVIVNLIVNARAAMSDGGTLTIATENRLLDAMSAAVFGVEPGFYAELSVSDTGPGIHEEVLPHLFEPFFTTREAVGGLGLGLSTCYGIVRQSRGSIVVDSTLGRGTTFRVVLPRIETT
jgi:signal transduction histidine kinase